MHSAALLPGIVCNVHTDMSVCLSVCSSVSPARCLCVSTGRLQYMCMCVSAHASWQVCGCSSCCCQGVSHPRTSDPAAARRAFMPFSLCPGGAAPPRPGVMGEDGARSSVLCPAVPCCAGEALPMLAGPAVGTGEVRLAGAEGEPFSASAAPAGAGCCADGGCWGVFMSDVGCCCCCGGGSTDGAAVACTIPKDGRTRASIRQAVTQCVASPAEPPESSVHGAATVPYLHT